MSDMNTYEYIWLDGYTPEPFMRSKVKATEDETPPEWSFDGSSTQQAEGGSSDCLLIPVQTYSNPDGHDLVMTEVQSADHTTHPSNFRAAAAEVVTDEWWFGFEQEYFLTDPATGEPLGWEDGEPREQGEYYCGVGAGNVVGREVSDVHLQACLDMGITLTGTNAEVALGQWEYQCFGKGIKAADKIYHVCPSWILDEIEVANKIIKISQGSDISLLGYHSVMTPHFDSVPSLWNKMQVQMLLMKSHLPFTVIQPAIYTVSYTHLTLPTNREV